MIAFQLIWLFWMRSIRLLGLFYILRLSRLRITIGAWAKEALWVTQNRGPHYRTRKEDMSLDAEKLSNSLCMKDELL